VVTAERSPARWPRWLIQIALGLLCAVLVVAGLVAVGNLSRDSLGPHDRYLLPFNEIECEAPPGQDRAEFLGEVQYAGKFPDRLNVLDPALPEELQAAFSKHRRVERVIELSVLPPRRIVVKLKFRI
jgi:hypothetical protein